MFAKNTQNLWLNYYVFFGNNKQEFFWISYDPRPEFKINLFAEQEWQIRQQSLRIKLLDTKFPTTSLL